MCFVDNTHPQSRSSSRLEAFHSEPYRHTHTKRYLAEKWPLGHWIKAQRWAKWATKNNNTRHQVDVVEDERGLVHLAKDQQHLVVNELLVLRQVAAHVLLQLTADLRGQRAKLDSSPFSGDDWLQGVKELYAEVWLNDAERLKWFHDDKIFAFAE